MIPSWYRTLTFRWTNRKTNRNDRRRSEWHKKTLQVEALEDRLVLSTAIGFAATSYRIAENAAVVGVTVNRFGDTTGTNSVTLNTRDESAIAGTNYTALT